MLGGIDRQGWKGKMLSQFLPELLTQVRHGGKAHGMLLPEPFPDLLNPEFFLADFFKILLQFGKRKMPDIPDCLFHPGQR